MSGSTSSPAVNPNLEPVLKLVAAVSFVVAGVYAAIHGDTVDGGALVTGGLAIGATAFTS